MAVGRYCSFGFLAVANHRFLDRIHNVTSVSLQVRCRTLTLSEKCLRLPSNSKYYLNVTELLGADRTDLINFLSKARKASLELFLRENLSQLSQSLKQNSIMLANLSENNRTLLHLKQSIQNLKPDFAANSSTDVTCMQQPSTLVEAFTKSLEQKGYDKVAVETFVFHKVFETSNRLNTKSEVEHVLKVAKTSIKQFKCLGPTNTDNNARPRPLEVVLSFFFTNAQLWQTLVC